VIDASALVAILLREPDAAAIRQRIEAAEAPFTSPLAIYESVARLVRVRDVGAAMAEQIVRALLDEFDARIVAIDDAMTSLAVDALERYGRGRHPAALNFGDCFAYACARAHKAPLICKGDGFARTDIG
jgi:ribonuclease VapC